MGDRDTRDHEAILESGIRWARYILVELIGRCSESMTPESAAILRDAVRSLSVLGMRTLVEHQKDGQ